MLGLEELAHPSLAAQVGKLDQLVESGGKFRAKYPELQSALVAQLPGLVVRDQMLAHDLVQHPKELITMKRGEDREVVASVWQAVRKNERVNGTTSREGGDVFVFQSIYELMMEARGEEIPPLVKLEILTGLGVMRLMTKIWGGFDPVSAISAVVEKNWINYPELPHKAPNHWAPKAMVEHYVTKTKPDLKAVRKHFPPDRVMPIALADAINEKRDLPPTSYRDIDGLVTDYQRLINNMAV